ncbi:MAG: butyrate kinase [Bacteroidales bacterium]|nr:butyrate kinase [Bacteroidales bacterium]
MNTKSTFQDQLILAIHPRVPFTNIGLFRNRQMIFLKKVMHPEAEHLDFKKYPDETLYRSKQILEELKRNDLPVQNIRIIISRGGLVKPVSAGVYRITPAMVGDLKKGVSGNDVLNLGGLIANELTRQIPNSSAYVADPVVVDEFDEIARVSGHPLFKRKSIIHALEQKSVARKYAKTIQKKYSDLNLIVAQMGNGITGGAHRKGKVIDSNQGLDGDGPFSPSRSGSIPFGDLIRLCYSGKYSENELYRMLTMDGGLFAYLGVHDGYSADHMARNGDEKAVFYLKAMAYQVAKTAGSMYAVLGGEVDAILLTGGLTHSKIFMDELLWRIRKIAPIHTYASEDDVETLALNGYYVLIGEIEPKDY